MTRKFRSIFLGDNITVGDGDLQACGWSSRLLRISASAESPLHCYNLGVGGGTASQLPKRCYREAVTRLSGKAYDGLVLTIGINAAIASASQNTEFLETEANIANLTQLLRAMRSFTPTIAIEPKPIRIEFSPDGRLLGPIVLEHLNNCRGSFKTMAMRAGVDFLEIGNILQTEDTFQAELLINNCLHPARMDIIILPLSSLNSSLWDSFLSLTAQCEGVVQ